MTESIGVRDLKNNASRIIRQVRETQAEYVVTVHGAPVAILRPLDAAEERRRRQEGWAAFLREAEAIAEAIGSTHGEPVHAVEAVAEQRRY